MAEEKGPETELELGTYALLRSFSHTSHRFQSRSFVPNLPLVLVTIRAVDLYTTIRTSLYQLTNTQGHKASTGIVTGIIICTDHNCYCSKLDFSFAYETTECFTNITHLLTPHHMHMLCNSYCNCSLISLCKCPNSVLSMLLIF